MSDPVAIPGYLCPQGSFTVASQIISSRIIFQPAKDILTGPWVLLKRRLKKKFRMAKVTSDVDEISLEGEESEEVTLSDAPSEESEHEPDHVSEKSASKASADEPEEAKETSPEASSESSEDEPEEVIQEEVKEAKDIKKVDIKAEMDVIIEADSKDEVSTVQKMSNSGRGSHNIESLRVKEPSLMSGGKKSSKVTKSKKSTSSRSRTSKLKKKTGSKASSKSKSSQK